ncbi:MAG: hypothetical protein R2707_18620 [Acidimicrobiales bacterium]
MRINCWHEVGRKNAAKDVVRVRNIPSARQKELRTAIRAARDGSGDGELFVLERGYSNRGRAVARLAVGVGVVVAMLAAVAAFLAPDSATDILGLGVIPAVMVAGFTAYFSSTYDTGVRISADGVLQTEGWGGIRTIDLRSFARVTVAEDESFDGMWIEG